MVKKLSIGEYFLESVNQILTKNKKGRAFNFSDLPNLHPKDYSYIVRFDVAISVRNLHFFEMRDSGNEASHFDRIA